MDFEIIGEIHDIKTFAVRKSIRDLSRLRKLYGGRRWRKRKGVALVRLMNGDVHQVELHWYEAHGVGRREMRIKRKLDD